MLEEKKDNEPLNEDKIHLEDDDFMNYYEEKSGSKNKQDKKVKEERTFAYEMITFGRDLVIILLVFWLITTFIGEKTNVIGDSMKPHIHDGDFFILNKLTYRFSEPKRFDIVVFPYNNSKANYIKRIIGMPGDVVEILDGQVYIDGEILGENFGIEPIAVMGNQIFPLTVPEGEYFVMGDNRNDSSDSRYQDVGTIPKEKLLGKTWLRIWPFNRIGFVE